MTFPQWAQKSRLQFYLQTGINAQRDLHQEGNNEKKDKRIYALSVHIQLTEW